MTDFRNIYRRNMNGLCIGPGKDPYSICRNQIPKTHTDALGDTYTNYYCWRCRESELEMDVCLECHRKNCGEEDDWCRASQGCANLDTMDMVLLIFSPIYKERKREIFARRRMCRLEALEVHEVVQQPMDPFPEDTDPLFPEWFGFD
jgi:hypothetical protein